MLMARLGKLLPDLATATAYQTSAGFWIGEAPPSSSLVYLPMVDK